MVILLEKWAFMSVHLKKKKKKKYYFKKQILPFKRAEKYEDFK